MWNVMEFANIWNNKSKVARYTWIKPWYELVSVNIKLQKHYIWILHVLHVCVSEWIAQMRGLTSAASIYLNNNL